MSEGLNAYQFVKIDTDSIDCEILRLLLEMQRHGHLSFETVTLETWAGKLCGNNVLFSALLADLQGDGYSVYRARNDNIDDFPAQTAQAVELTDDISVFSFPVEQCVAAPPLDRE